MVMPVKTVNSPARTEDSATKGLLWLSVRTVIFPEGTAIPEGFKLSRALLAEMEITPDGFVIRSGEVHEEWYGSTYETAYLDFLTSLRDRYHSLSRREGRLSAEDRYVLERLRSLLKPIEW